uniref:Podocalyxin n=1 Tax=Cyanoderma ruficeps TaxID=181631 RepID=A0A8C3QFE3_9PASS
MTTATTETTTTIETTTTTELTTTTETTTTTEPTTTTETTTTTEITTTAETTTTVTTAGTTETSTTTASPPTTALTTTTATTEKGTTQLPVGTSPTAETTTTTTTTTLAPSTATSLTTVTGTSPTSTATTLPSLSGQESSTHSATTPAASSTTSQQPSSATATSGSSGTTTAAKLTVTTATSPPGAVGAAGTSSPTTQPLGSLPKTTVSSTVARTDSSQSSKDCVVPPPKCPTKQPLSSSSPAAHAPTPSTSSGSTGTSVTTPVGSPSLATTQMSPPGSKKAATTTAPGADRSTHHVGPAPGKPTSASQSPDSTQPPDQAESCGSGHQQPNISHPNELICEDQVQHARPTIQLKEPRTCDEWRTASNNHSFFESFCSTAQHVFNASRDRCTVTLMACQPHSRHWAVWVVLHHPLDSEEVLKELKEKKDRLEELGIVNITSDKMVEDMTINDEFSTPLIITIITLAGSLLLIAAIYGCHQRFSQRKDQNIHPDVPGFDDGHVALIFNRLTEEMQTMENGYHDNPTLEVMETSSEMQEKKVNLNGELGDSWIVPLDTLMKEDLEEEEDTHL